MRSKTVCEEEGRKEKRVSRNRFPQDLSFATKGSITNLSTEKSSIWSKVSLRVDLIRENRSNLLRDLVPVLICSREKDVKDEVRKKLTSDVNVLALDDDLEDLEDLPRVSLLSLEDEVPRPSLNPLSVGWARRVDRVRLPPLSVREISKLVASIEHVGDGDCLLWSDLLPSLTDPDSDGVGALVLIVSFLVEETLCEYRELGELLDGVGEVLLVSSIVGSSEGSDEEFDDETRREDLSCVERLERFVRDGLVRFRRHDEPIWIESSDDSQALEADVSKFLDLVSVSSC